MNFVLFALVIAVAFFVSSLALLNFGRHLGLRYLQQQKGAGSMAGLTTVRLDRVAAGIHDFWRTPTVRRSPTTGSSGGKRSQHGL